MLDHLDAREAFRARLNTFVMATTGTMSLGATTVGYTRLTGSFKDDGFRAGMEVVPAGFPTNTVKIIKSVDDSLVSIEGGVSAVAAAGSRSLTVGLPQDKQLAGTQNPVSTAPATRPRLIEQWVPGPVEDSGGIVDTGFYVVTWNALANKGIGTSLKQMTALRNHFPPGLTFNINGDLVRVIGKPAPSFTQPITTDNGYETSTLRIAWRVITTNLSAA